MNENTGAKERIMDVVIKLLQEQKDISKITNRQIAQMAGVNSALINYYYQSKENLVNTAVGFCMGDIAKTILKKSASENHPVHRVKNLVKAISDFAFSNYTFAEIVFSSELKHGSINTIQMIIPLLKEIFGDKKTDIELKLMAFQLIIPMQVMFLNAKEYTTYLSHDLWDIHSRNKLLDKLVNNMFDYYLDELNC
ncbi:TetR family transcriptional regulator [Alkalibaculum sp. M08DMB]|uniref:TetR family transcriptional regulator n=1 Tax=Alkalibaculum sporogenes TaxID=2655001 RepID=A0A6A7K8B1_9FIRM|nr:TetR/AcrR family transcriptional regulator [Alkalibaculum sporogenes]MPW25447.1 TetR family transcriptional regulator [Alkalibaculum sporogenes]